MDGRVGPRVVALGGCLLTVGILASCTSDRVPSASVGVEHGATVGPPRFCGGCDPDCRLTTDEPVQGELDDPTIPVWGESVAYDPAKSGIVIVPPGVRVISDYAWLANTSVSTVTKVHLQTLAADGVYRVGLQSVGTGGNLPSRTTVDILGCAYVANRAFGRQGSVTKIAGDLEDCTDLNGNGVIDTSTGLGDIRGWPGTATQDECVLWNAPVGPPGGTPRALAIDALGRIWVGLWETQQFVVLDSVDGSEIATLNIDIRPYGAAVAPDGRLWAANPPGYIQAINTYAPILTDAAVERPPVASPENSYGMAVDADSRVLVSRNSAGGFQRYDPATGLWDLVGNTGGRSTGVVADEWGNVFTGDISDDAVTMYDGVGLVQTDLFDLGAWGATRPKGVCPDFYGRVWAANMGSANVSVIEPGVGVIATIPVQSWNYTYSDFTGYGLMTFAAMVGYVFRDYDSAEACGGPSIRERVFYRATFPNPGALQFHGRSADTEAGLATAPESWLGSVDEPTGSVPIRGPMSDAEASRRFFRLRIELLRGGVESPVLHEYTIEEYCL